MAGSLRNIPPRNSPKARERLTAVRVVLRHLDHPDRLRENPLVEWQFRRADGLTAAARIKRLVAQAIGDLPARQREIVTRCDLRGQSHQSVLAALAVSERHFYRERRSALEALARTLEAASHSLTEHVIEFDQGSAAMEFCFADTSYQAGDLDRALRMLRKVSADANDPKRRIQLECRLAELSCEAGDIAAAKRHVDKSRMIWAGIDDDGDRATIVARIQAVEATIMWRSVPSGAAVELAQRSAMSLRAALMRNPTVQDAEAFGLAHLVLGERHFTMGEALLGRQELLEALVTLSRFDDSRALLKIRLKAGAATALMFDSSRLEDAESELYANYREALASGLALEATLIGWRLSNFHRFSQSHDRAVRVLNSLLPAARQLLPREERAGMCLDLASAYLVCGNSVEARRLIAEAQPDALPGGFCQALAPLIAAEACLLEGAYDQTLALGDEGMRAMRRLGRQQSVVNGLRLQAEAHYALGDVSAARTCIGTALEEIDGSPHPLVIAKTHRTAARITGGLKHQRIADDIFRALRA